MYMYVPNMYNQFSTASLYSGHLVIFLANVYYVFSTVDNPHYSAHFIIPHGCPLYRGFTTVCQYVQLWACGNIIGSAVAVFNIIEL
jgi:hypothetical protein